MSHPGHLQESRADSRPLPRCASKELHSGPRKGRLRPGRGAQSSAFAVHPSAPPTSPSPEPRLHSAQTVGRASVLACAGRDTDGDIRMVGVPPGRGCARASTLPRPACACAAEARRGAVRFRRRGPAWRGSGPGRAGPGPKCLYFSPRCWSCCWLRLAHSS